MYATCLANGFVWDDNTYIVTNRVYRTADLASIFFSLGNGVEYLPVRDLSHVVDFLLWGDAAAGFHLANVIVYGGCVLAVYLFARRLGLLLLPSAAGERVGATALAAAALFALHPLHSEVVAWLTGRNTLLCGLFFFLSAAAYTRFLLCTGLKKGVSWAGALLFFILALFSKAPAIVLPPILLLLSAWSRRGSLPARVLPVLPFFAVAGGVFVLFRQIALKIGVIPPAAADPAQNLPMDKLAVAVQIPFFYLAKLFLPLDLAAEYAATFSRSPVEPEVIFSAAGLLALILAAWFLRRRYPPLAFSIGFFLLSLLPVLNLFRTYPTVADRYAFLPSFALAFLLASPLLVLPKRFLPHFCLAGAATAIFWGGLAFNASAAWRSDETLWERGVTAQPRSAMAHYQLGRVYYRTGRFDAAMEQFSTAQELDPRHPYHDFFRGYLCLLDNNYDCAVGLFTGCLEANREFIDPLYHLAYVFEKMGRKEEAAEYYHRVTVARERDASGFRRLAKDRLRMLRRS